VLLQQAEAAERQAGLAAARVAGQGAQVQEDIQNDLEMTIDGRAMEGKMDEGMEEAAADAHDRNRQ
jgi:hypothetical protein